jgi:glycosyl-4,4'-diaponeurosporenoate acyltransferase
MPSLPTAVAISSSAAFWLLASLLIGFLANQLPEAWLVLTLKQRSGSEPHRGRLNASLRHWKHWIPDAGSFFPGGLAKASLVSRDPSALRMLVVETRRAELVHAILWPAALLTALWLPAAGILVNLLFACLFNLPCLMLQRSTRQRVLRILSRQNRSQIP